MKHVLFLLLLVYVTACGSKVVVILESREIISLDNGTEPRPGWYGISGGFLREIYQQCGGNE